MRIKKDNEWKTMFRTRYCYFKYQVVLFKLSNILASFQNYINKILIENLNVFGIFYLYDIFIYIRDLYQIYINTIW